MHREGRLWVSECWNTKMLPAFWNFRLNCVLINVKTTFSWKLIFLGSQSSFLWYPCILNSEDVCVLCARIVTCVQISHFYELWDGEKMPMASHKWALMVRIYLSLVKIAITAVWNLNRKKDWIKQKLNKYFRNVVLDTQVYLEK